MVLASTIDYNQASAIPTFGSNQILQNRRISASQMLDILNGYGNEIDDLRAVFSDPTTVGMASASVGDLLVFDGIGNLPRWVSTGNIGTTFFSVTVDPLLTLPPSATPNDYIIWEASTNPSDPNFGIQRDYQINSVGVPVLIRTITYPNFAVWGV